MGVHSQWIGTGQYFWEVSIEGGQKCSHCLTEHKGGVPSPVHSPRSQQLSKYLQKKPKKKPQDFKKFLLLQRRAACTNTCKPMSIKLRTKSLMTQNKQQKQIKVMLMPTSWHKHNHNQVQFLQRMWIWRDPAPVVISGATITH